MNVLLLTLPGYSDLEAWEQTTSHHLDVIEKYLPESFQAVASSNFSQKVREKREGELLLFSNHIIN